jgi:Ni/Co efflux regulator RcnB
MKRILIALAALSLFSLATPATAQDGRHHDSDWRRNHHRSDITVDVGSSYARSHCAVKVTKIYRNGRTITRRVRRCD